jgi:hypothetical protein
MSPMSTDRNQLSEPPTMPRPGVPQPPPTAHPVQRHLEGWPLGLWLVGVAALSAALVVPRDVEPQSVPTPRVDRVSHARQLESDARHARAARGGLSRQVRSVGEALRRLGQATFEGSAAAPQLRRQLRRLARAVHDESGPEALLALRALQADLFVQAARSQARTDAALASTELQQLGGPLTAQGHPARWFDPYPRGAHPHELRALFAIHFSRSVGLDVLGARLAPTLNEWRLYYRFLLGRPLPQGEARQRAIAERLRYVAELSRHDPSYPEHLARGILHYQADDFAAALGELSTHLRIHPDGRFALRARNHLAAAGARISQ